jgi:hypothetical protein
MAGKRLRSACRSAARIAVFFAVLHLADQGFARLTQIGPANFTYRFTFPDRLVLHDAKTRALLGE